jgi:5'-methylthioadenosine phosphorylase
MARLAIIGGTGLEKLRTDFDMNEEIVETAYGVGHVYIAHNGTAEIVFQPRHDPEHSLLPHQINFRANILALKAKSVTHILASNAVGSLRPDLPPGELVLLSDFIDFSHGRNCTLFETDRKPMEQMHTDFSAPYSPVLREYLLDAAADTGVDLLPRGVYICTSGPRYETPAEIRLFSSWGADVVGMTGLPEAVLAREAGMEYAAVAIVTNFAAGISHKPIHHTDVVAKMQSKSDEICQLYLETALRLI